MSLVLKIYRCLFFGVCTFSLSSSLVGCLPPPQKRNVGPLVVTPKSETEAEKLEREKREAEEKLLAEKLQKEEAEKLSQQQKDKENTAPDGGVVDPKNAVRAFVTANFKGQYKNCFSYKFDGQPNFEKLACNKKESANTCVAPADVVPSAGVLLAGTNTASDLRLTFLVENFKQSAEACPNTPSGDKQYKYATTATSSFNTSQAAIKTDLEKQFKCGKKVVQRDGKSITRFKLCFEDNPVYDPTGFNDFIVLVESENAALNLNFGVACTQNSILDLNDTVCK